MTSALLNVFAVFVLGVFFTGILIPQILLISFRRNLFDTPDPRKIHKGVVPRLGGIAFKPVLCFSVVLMVCIDVVAGAPEYMVEAGSALLPLGFGYCSLTVLYLIGIADDLIGIRYRAKFMAQIFCAAMLIAGGVWIDDLHGVLGIGSLPVYVGYPLTVLVIVFFINAINLIDGIDGLASGLSSVALIIYGITFFLQEQYIYSMIAFATLGVLVPFFCYNVFGDAERHRKIFMGDTGSLTIGLIIGILSIELLKYGTRAGEPSRIMALAFTPMIIPCLDVVRVFFVRLRQHRNPFLPDKTHIHHKLLDLGLPQWAALITILILSLAYTAFNIALSPYIDITLLAMLDIVLWLAANILITRRIKKIKGEQKNN